MEKAVPAIAEEDWGSNLDGIESMLAVMTESMIERWKDKAKQQLAQVIDDEIFRSEYPELKRIEEDVEKLKSLITRVSRKLCCMIRDNNQAPDPENGAISEAEEDFEIPDEVLRNFSNKECLSCLSVFPENMAIKKRPLIYWWIGEGLVAEKKEEDGRITTAEEAGEKVFEELLEKGIIKPSSSSSFIVYPWVRWRVIQLYGGYRQWAFLKLVLNNLTGVVEIGNDNNQVVTIFNVNKKYLGSEVEEVLKYRPKLKVVQMGRWQSSATHHIEAAEDYKKLLGSLASQKELKYLSLRGISRIEDLPESIEKLTTLQILDLRACHNLEQLQGISKLKMLTHLDVSECYLLDRMPKGLDSLTKLQVLKGFVVSNSCKISDLAKLLSLRKLSIRVGQEGQGQLKSLDRLSSTLKILTISWGLVSVSSHTPAEVSLPKNLIKLDLRAVPFDTLPTWLQPTQMVISKLKKLYIKGGKLKHFNYHDYPNLTLLRVNYLNHLKPRHQQD